MDRDNEIELIQTIQEKDKRIKELETINESITRELLSRTEKLENVLKEKRHNVMSKSEAMQKIELELIDLEDKMDKEYNKYGKSSTYLDLEYQYDLLCYFKDIVSIKPIAKEN